MKKDKQYISRVCLEAGFKTYGYDYINFVKEELKKQNKKMNFGAYSEFGNIEVVDIITNLDKN